MVDQKKKILFVMNSLHMGGAENSLISLLNIFNYDQFSVDLLLLKREGVLLKQVPKQVNLLSYSDTIKFFDMSVKKAILHHLKKLNIRFVIDRIGFGVIQKKNKNQAIKEQHSWKFIKNHLPKVSTNYDVAIGYLEKTPNYFVVDCVNAKKKIGFIRTDYEKMGMDKNIDFPYFEKLDFIFCNSENSSSLLQKLFPLFEKKIKTVQNNFSVKLINELAKEQIVLPTSQFSIVSVGRLTKSKNFDFAIDVCQLLVQAGLDLKWFVIGEGSYRKELETRITNTELNHNFILLGEKENPYPYIKNASIFVHPSEFEGKSRVVEEAKILHKPIVVNNYPSASEQITNNVTGFISENNTITFKNTILNLLSQKELQEQLSNNLLNTINIQEMENSHIFNYL